MSSFGICTLVLSRVTYASSDEFPQYLYISTSQSRACAVRRTSGPLRFPVPTPLACAQPAEVFTSANESGASACPYHCNWRFRLLRVIGSWCFHLLFTAIKLLSWRFRLLRDLGNWRFRLLLSAAYVSGASACYASCCQCSVRSTCLEFSGVERCRGSH
jgi:hypothetical protein